MTNEVQSTVKERGILFRGEMVRAILEGRKTQTRRVITESARLGYPAEEIVSAGPFSFRTEGGLQFRWRCPYGKAGDQLWVRETFLPRLEGQAFIYRADLSSFDAAGIGGMYGNWKPSIFMPRRASRITLEITCVRVERVQEISKADCIAEGMTGLEDIHAGWHQSYAALWNSMRAGTEFAWERNPWGWVIEFKRV